MSNALYCPECPACDHRSQTFRFDPDRHVGVIRCAECGEHLFMVSVLANKGVTTVLDPMADPLPPEVFETLDESGRLPPAVRDEVGQ